MIDKIHILVYGSSVYDLTASGQRIRNLLKPLLRDQKVVTSNLVVNRNKTEFDSFPFPVNFLNITVSFFNIISVLKFLNRSFSFIKTNKKSNTLNVFYCYSYPEIENIGLLLYAKWKKYKIVFDIVEDFKYVNLSKSSWKHRLNVFFLLKTQNLIPKIGSVCFAISTYLVQHCNKICKSKIPVVFLPISVDIEEVLRFKNSKNGLDHVKIFYGGSFSFKDGIQLLLTAFKMACLQNDHLELILTGRLSKDIQDDFTRLISSSPVYKKITYLGCLPVEEYLKTMVNADILCMVRINSHFANAGFPFKLGEYMASGNAIVATDVGDVSYYVHNNENAILVESESVDQIKEAILILAKDKELRNRIGEEAYNTALRYFDMNNVSNILYLNLLTLMDT